MKDKEDKKLSDNCQIYNNTLKQESSNVTQQDLVYCTFSIFMN